MNAKTYYSSSSFHHDNDLTNHDRSNCSASSRCLDTSIPSIFYRIGTVGQDNRLCLWDITEDLLKLNVNNSKKSPLISSPSTSNGHSSLVPSLPPESMASSHVAPSKSSFSSLTSRLSFVRNSNKVNKSLDDTPDLGLANLSNGLHKKSRKLSSGSKSSSGKLTTTMDDSLSTLTTMSSSSSYRMNFDLTKTTFGTHLCPKLDEIQVIEPIVTELIAHERLNGIYFGENYFLTSSQDGIIAIWEKPQKFLSTTVSLSNSFISRKNSLSFRSRRMIKQRSKMRIQIIRAQIFPVNFRPFVFWIFLLSLSLRTRVCLILEIFCSRAVYSCYNFLLSNNKKKETTIQLSHVFSFILQ